MIRTTLDKAYIKRTLRELYSHSASTAADMVLDPAWDRSVDIYPGMALMLKADAAAGASDYVTLVDATGVPYGLCGVYIAPGYGIDEVADSGVNAVPVWKLSEGSEFEVLAPAFDTTETWTFPTNGTALLVHVQTAGADRGKLVPAGATGASTAPVARAVSRPSTDSLIITGLGVGAAY
jgi:hypothetical protein